MKKKTSAIERISQKMSVERIENAPKCLDDWRECFDWYKSKKLTTFKNVYDWAISLCMNASIFHEKRLEEIWTLYKVCSDEERVLRYSLTKEEVNSTRKAMGY